MKIRGMIMEWLRVELRPSRPLTSCATDVEDRRQALYEMVTVGVTDDPASVVIAEIERLDEAIGRQI